MGKSTRKKKNSGSNGLSDGSVANANANHGVVSGSALLLGKAYELKEEGNKRFQAKDYLGALVEYDKAIRLTPNGHPDRAVYHSNRAACLMQMKPVDYEAVISECTLALQTQPLHSKALLRRARAFEHVAKLEMAMQDIQKLLETDPCNQDALQIARRLRTSGASKQDAQQNAPSRPSPASLGASGPCLPPQEKVIPSTLVASERTHVEFPSVNGTPHLGDEAHISSLPPQAEPVSLVPVLKREEGVPWNPLKAAHDHGIRLAETPMSSLPPQAEPVSLVPTLKRDEGVPWKPLKLVPDHGLRLAKLPTSSLPPQAEPAVPWKPLKLVYDHDIRLAEMPVNCTFQALRGIVAKRFPSSKSVLVKYMDNEGDWVTITSTKELRLAEFSLHFKINQHGNTLRLNIVEVNPEQEPPCMEEEQQHADDTCNSGKEQDREERGDPEMDDWLFDFAHLFRAHLGIDPNAHIDLQELGMEHLSEAIDGVVACEEAESLFDKAALTFQESVALAYFNWGNVCMCAARKRIPTVEEATNTRLEDEYVRAREEYSLAGEKYAEALRVKPDFYEGIMAMGQQQFEMAKLQWSYALMRKADLSQWDSTETFRLLNGAEVKMKEAGEAWSKMEEEREESNSKEKKMMMKNKKKNKNKKGMRETPPGFGGLIYEEAAEQAAIVKSQMDLFWANILFDRSQIEYELGLNNWKDNLDSALCRFALAGASHAQVSLVRSHHPSVAKD